MMKALGLTLGGMAVASLGCIVSSARPTPSKPIVEFPTQAKLAAVEAQPATVPPIAEGAVPADGWTVDGAAMAVPGRLSCLPCLCVQVPAPSHRPVAPEAWTPGSGWDQAFAAA